MYEGKYWSVADCAWVDCPRTTAAEAEVAVPQQRDDEAAQEPVEA